MSPSPATSTNESSTKLVKSMRDISALPRSNYGSFSKSDKLSRSVPQSQSNRGSGRRSLEVGRSLQEEVTRLLALSENTRSHHHVDSDTNPSDSLRHYPHDGKSIKPPQDQKKSVEFKQEEDDGSAVVALDSNVKTFQHLFSHSTLRKLALDLSLYINIAILLAKAIAYLETLSLSILAALVDSVLDVVSQWILAYTEHRSSKNRSSAHYPAGAARLEPLGVLSCAALMGFASFGVLKEALETFYQGVWGQTDTPLTAMDDQNWSSFWSMFTVVFIKLGLWVLCKRVGYVKEEEQYVSAIEEKGTENETKISNNTSQVYCVDSTMEALAQDHWNDCLSNAVAAVALLFALSNERLWILDPIGAMIISLYIIFSWYATGKEQIEQLTGKAAPSEFIEELYEMANNFDSRMDVDVVRAYHFGPKFLVELEVVLPRDTLLFESHDLGMELQYEIESREEVERCFVHIDYESRPYDEHVVSKVPELRERYRPYSRWTSAVNSV